MKLCIKNLPEIYGTESVSLPEEQILRLPEKVLQFGTGVFLRGFIDYIFDKANKEGVFNGRAVVVKSTTTGDVDDFVRQDNLYTLIMRSMDEGITIEDKVVCAAISRVILAEQNWKEVLECAANKELRIIISNTTETGIELLAGDLISNDPPISFPAKLLGFLYQRFLIFDGDPSSGMVIIPTELIRDNGTKLKAILNTLALQNNLDDQFIVWLNKYNDFCNSLVDRIVPGKPPSAEHHKLQKELGYTDDLMVMSETFGLWAIETKNDRSRCALSFSNAYAGVHLVENIEKFRELKLRLLNGSHNLSCAVGFLAGFRTVKEAMADPFFNNFMQKLILVEISNAIVSENISLLEAQEFGAKVLERYHNPYIEFDWLNICVEDTAKLRIRALQIILQHAQKYNYVPPCICLGFAAYILFMRSKKGEDGFYWGINAGQPYLITDNVAMRLADYWEKFEEGEKQETGARLVGNKCGSNESGQINELVRDILSDRDLWQEDLSMVNGFMEEVGRLLSLLLERGVAATLRLQG